MRATRGGGENPGRLRIVGNRCGFHCGEVDRSGTEVVVGRVRSFHVPAIGVEHYDALSGRNLADPGHCDPGGAAGIGHLRPSAGRRRKQQLVVVTPSQGAALLQWGRLPSQRS